MNDANLRERVLWHRYGNERPQPPGDLHPRRLESEVPSGEWNAVALGSRGAAA